MKLSNIPKRSSSTLSSQTSSLVSSPIDALPSGISDTSGAINTNSIWNKTVNQALTWFKPSEIAGNKTNNKNQSMPLNAYLTYVTLKLPLIMHGILK